MQAMVLMKPGAALVWTDLPDGQPGPDEIRIKVTACGVCRTDLHVLDGELPDPKVPIIPGHEIVGRLDAIGLGVEGLRIKPARRRSVAWPHLRHLRVLHAAAGESVRSSTLHRVYSGRRLRDGIHRRRAVCVPPRRGRQRRGARPLALRGVDRLAIAGHCRRRQKLGIYGFGAAAHIVAQIAKWQERSVFAFTRPGDVAKQAFARRLGRHGRVDRTSYPRSRSTPRSSMQQSATSCPWR